MGDAFISYSHTDREWVLGRLLPRLEAAGLSVIIDERDFEVGVPSLINMERAVERSQYTIAVLTPAWLESEWTEYESLLVGVADPTGRKRKLVPLMLVPCNPPVRIGILTYADFTQPQNWEPQFVRLVAQLGRPSPSAKPGPGVTSPSVGDYVTRIAGRLVREGFTYETAVAWEGQQFGCVASITLSVFGGFVRAPCMLLFREFVSLSDVSFKDYIEHSYRFASRPPQPLLLKRDRCCVPIAVVDNANQSVVDLLRNQAFFEKTSAFWWSRIFSFPVIYDKSSGQLHTFEGLTIQGMALYPILRKRIPEYLQST
jgi:hypothetical protein